VQRATAGGAVAWTPDNKGLYYTHYPAAGEKPDTERDFWQQVYFHQLGTPVAKDRYELGKDFPKNAEIVMDSDARGRVIASVQQGDGGIFRHYLRDAKGWHQLDDWNDQIVLAVFGGTPDLWLVSRKDAPHGKLMKLAATAKTAAEAAVVVPEGKDSIVTEFQPKSGVLAVGDRLYVNYQLGGPSEIRAFSVTGKPQKAPVGPNVSAASAPVAWRGDVLVNFSSYTTPATWTRFSSKTGKLAALPDFTETYPVDFSNIEARRESATSKDGTAVPLNIMWPKGAPQDGTVPCIVYGYGGYGINEEPAEWISFAPLLSRGFCVVDVNLRGGSEFGEDWHRNGMLLKKQNVFDDFASALDYLVAKHYTNRQRLGIMGGSNGGLLVGVMMTERPELFGAVVCEAPLLDMKRYNQLLAGASWMEEYGDPAVPAEWAAISKYSPYQNVHKDAKYPPVLFTTSTRDDRVHPGHARKMAARMIEQGHDVLFYENIEGGHAGAADNGQRAFMSTLAYAFLWKQLGVK
jgi:prolyl oligopeptidase